jgi:hypothetical protein
LWVHHVTPKIPKPCTPFEFWKNLAHLLGITKTWQNQNLACLSSYWQKLAKKNSPLPAIGKTCQNQNEAFKVLAKLGMPFPIWAKPKPPLPIFGKIWQNQNLAFVLGASKT